QRVPLIGGYFRVRPFLLGAPAIDRVVDGDVVFESIGTRDVVVVGVLARQMRPPARSVLPEMGLNFTSTKPSLMLVSSLMQMGNVARPDCFRTFGLLGAVSSLSTVHFAAPLPVWVAVQPGGGAPVSKLSKLTVSASATLLSTAAASVIAIPTAVFMGSSIPCHWPPFSLGATLSPT